MGDWRMARSLDRLLVQINDFAPRRSRASDGGIADARHPTSSDHSPKRFPWADRPLVLARDFTHDPVGGLDCQRLYQALAECLDQRVRYIIWQRRITAGNGGPSPWIPRPYTGPNPHDRHLHLSVVHDARADSVIPWRLRLNAPVVARPTLRRGDTGDAVKLLQRFLGVVEADEPGYGQFGPRTELAVRKYQAMRGIAVDGRVGPVTWSHIESGL